MKFGIFFIAPNAYRDAQRTFDELLEQAVYTEELGFDSLWVAEHHSAYGMCGSPPVLLSAIAQRTSRVRLGAAVSILPFQNPVRIAEDYALVDVLSHGRLDFGAGRGNSDHEYHKMRSDKAAGREIFWEAMDIILALWNEDGPIDYHGAHFHFDQIEAYPKPVQRPVPVWVAAVSPETFPMVGERGLQVTTAPLAAPSFADWKERVCNGARSLIAAGRDPATIDFPVTMDVHIAESPERARDNFEHALWTMHELAPVHHLAAVPETPARPSVPAWSTAAELFDDRARRGGILVTDPAGAIDYIAALQEELGLKQFVCAMQLGDVAHADVLRSMQLFAEEVMPAFAGTETPVPASFLEPARPVASSAAADVVEIV